MKKTLRILSVLILTFFIGKTALGQSGACIYPLHQPWDLGRIEKGKIKNKVFFIRNIGDKDLVINRVHSCCGYNITDVSSWEAAPDKTIKLVISLDSGKKNAGKDEKAVTVDSNDIANPVLKIPVSSFIVVPSER